MLACGGRARDELVVLAAASLAGPFRAAAEAFEAARPSVRVRLSFAGSQTLAAQLRAGAPADLIATANDVLMRALAEDGLVVDPTPFASSPLVWVCAETVSARDAEELARALPNSDWRIVLAAPEVPAGRYALAVLSAQGLREAAQLRLVSRELDVRGVLSKLRLGAADCGLVYAPLVEEAPSGLVVVPLPETIDVAAQYWIASTKRADESPLAHAFLHFVARGEGQALLRDAAFGPAS